MTLGGQGWHDYCPWGKGAMLIMCWLLCICFNCVNMAVLSTIVFTLISLESFTPALKYITNQSVSSSHHRLFLDGRLAGSSCLVGLCWHRALADILTTSFEAAVCMLLVFRDDPHGTKTPFYLELGPLPCGHMQNITQQHKSIIWCSIGGISRKKKTQPGSLLKPTSLVAFEGNCDLTCQGKWKLTVYLLFFYCSEKKKMCDTIIPNMK